MQTRTALNNSDQRIIAAILAERDDLDKQIAALKNRKEHVETMMAIARTRPMPTNKIDSPKAKFTTKGLGLIQGGRTKGFVPMTYPVEKSNLYIVPVA